jgi:hypothetical protein
MRFQAHHCEIRRAATAWFTFDCPGYPEIFLGLGVNHPAACCRMTPGGSVCVGAGAGGSEVGGAAAGTVRTRAVGAASGGAPAWAVGLDAAG